eukprot:3486866-Amphidinium_carterae.1
MDGPELISESRLAMNAEEVVRKVRYFASVSRTLSKDESAELACMVLSICTVLVENTTEFFRTHTGP